MIHSRQQRETRYLLEILQHRKVNKLYQIFSFRDAVYPVYMESLGHITGAFKSCQLGTLGLKIVHSNRRLASSSGGHLLSSGDGLAGLLRLGGRWGVGVARPRW